MAELETQNASVALYKYMCRDIVGTEVHVRTLRLMNNVRDNLQSDNDSATITSGSFGEGLQMRGSDLDIMRVMRYVQVSEHANIDCTPDTIYFTMETEDTPPGFTKLRLLHSNDQSIFEDCDEIGGGYYILNSFKQRLPNYLLPNIHGPCLSDKQGMLDIAICFHSKSWITSAKQWITRSNNSWPGNFVKQSIAKHGVLFVPLGMKGSIKEELEWRLSFSVAEKLLVYTFTHTQLLCYALMKILLKDVIALNLNCKELLCSYFMKTVMFWISEELATSIWRPDNLISCFMRCLRRLIFYVEYSVCPHYFMPKINLFENKIKGHVQKMLLNKLHVLHSYGWKCILFSDQISNFKELAFHISKKASRCSVRSVEQLLSTVLFSADSLPSSHYLLFEKSLQMVFSTTSSRIKFLYTYYMSKYCYKIGQLLTFDHLSGNKSTYKQYNVCLTTILLNTRHDAVSGWLLLASLFFKTKHYNSALHIINYALSKCTPEKAYPFTNLSNENCKLLNLHSFRNMTIVQLRKLLLLDFVCFVYNSVLIPDELQIEVEKDGYLIQPEVYAHFLRFLIYFHQQNTSQYRNSLRDLQMTIQDNRFIENSLWKAFSYNILGIGFHLLQNMDLAKQSFLQSIESCPDKDLNSAFRRLALIL